MTLLSAPAFKVVRSSKGKFRLVSPLVYRWVCRCYTVTVPTGTETDFASIPRGFRNIIATNGRHRLPAVLHDYLYGCAGVINFQNEKPFTYTRKEADKIFHTAMREENVGKFKAATMYHAVRVFGGLHLRRSGGKAWR